MGSRRLALVRILGVIVVAFGITYLTWRWTSTIAWDAWWIALPLVIAETYSLGESILFALTMWNAKARPAPPAALPGRTVDVFITTYNEPLEIVAKTALAARVMHYPHRTGILDDGGRDEFREAAQAMGVGYIKRGDEWIGRRRFAKAGNVNNALFQTDGELVAILDSDQVPLPHFLDRVIGYFDDPDVSFVQTPQVFWNVEQHDPLGSQAELFYGPIQQGKDGWDAAFFCGSNAVLRREALMALGLTRFARNAFGAMRSSLRTARSRLLDMRGSVALRHPDQIELIEHILHEVENALARVRSGDVLSEVSFDLRENSLGAISPGTPTDVASELIAILDATDVSHTDEALALHPLDTASITEDMATAMHLHAMGWRSVYHHETLVYGLAPEDLATMLSQRLRWASGSMQVFFADNPLALKGLSFAQRLMYVSTMTSCLSGFAALAFIIAPIVFLTTGVMPLHAEPLAFLTLFVPSYLLCQLFFQVAGHGSRGLWRGQQMSFALFPTWIMATIAGFSAKVFHRHLAFSVTAKTRQAKSLNLRHIRVQLIAIFALIAASIAGVLRVVAGDAAVGPTTFTLLWVVLDVLLLGAVVVAARYHGPATPPLHPIPDTAELDAVLTAYGPDRDLRLEREALHPSGGAGS